MKTGIKNIDEAVITDIIYFTVNEDNIRVSKIYLGRKAALNNTKELNRNTVNLKYRTLQYCVCGNDPNNILYIND